MAKVTKPVSDPKKKDEPKSHHQQMHDELKKDVEKGDPYHYGFVTGAEAIKFPEKISTGSLWMDIELSGGFRCGWSRFSGEPKIGKTNQGLCWGAAWQKKFPKDGFVVAFNAEGRITADLCVNSGIDTSEERFIRLDSNHGDYVVNKINSWISHNPFKKRYFFLIDSSDALIRAHDLDKGADSAEKIGGGATLLSFAGKRLSLPISVFGHHLYITSQLRDKMNSPQGGKGESGGNAPRFYSSLSGRMRKLFVKGREDGNIYDKDGKTIIGRKTLSQLYKLPNDKSSAEVILHIKEGKLGGIWKEYEILALCEVFGLIERKGSWFAPSETFFKELKDEKIIDDPFSIQGELPMVRYFEEETALTNYIEARIRKTYIPQ